MLSTTLLALAVSVAGAQAEADRDELTSLLKKKRQALALAADMLEETLNCRMVPGTPGEPVPMFDGHVFFSLAHALVELAKVDVALAESDDQRVQILQELVKKMRKYEKQVTEYHQAGMATLVDTCLFRAALVDAEIMLLRQESAATSRARDTSDDREARPTPLT